MESSVLFLALRRLRAPLLLLIAVYSIGIVGLVLIPGRDAAGADWHLSFFQAFYFMSYTASTIGFGEIPREFTDTQRLWVTTVIYLAVIGWAFTLASLLTLLQDAAFRRALVTSRFARRVREINEPFYLVCGFGETGMMLGRAFDHLGLRFVALDIDTARIQELELLDLAADAAGLHADARLPANLELAGLTKAECRGVLAITSDDAANLAIAISVRLLNPKVPVLCRAHSADTVANMASFGTDHIINPFTVFGDYVALAMEAPGVYGLVSWLTGLPGTTLEAETAPPRGRWIVCGYGRFGRELVKALQHMKLDITVIEPRPDHDSTLNYIVGRGTEAVTLHEANIEHAVGIVAGTQDDINNLSIAMTARELVPELFVITRQNLQANRRLFEAFAPDINMVASEIVAHQCLGILINPLLGALLADIRGQDDAWARAATARLLETVGPEVPQLWSVRITPAEAPAIYRGLVGEGLHITLGDLLRAPDNRALRLAAVAVYLVRDGTGSAMPAEASSLERTDEILFAGTSLARARQSALLRNVKVRDYVLTGEDVPESWLWQWWARTRQ